MLAAIEFVRRRHPFWDRSGGADHILTLPGDFAGCFRYQPNLARSVESVLRRAILLQAITPFCNSLLYPLCDPPLP